MCIRDRAIRAGRLIGADDAAIKQLLDEIGLMIRDIPLNSTSPEIAEMIYARIHAVTGCDDPYGEIKKQSTEKALEIYPWLKELVANADNPFVAAVKIAIAGNIIDFGVHDTFDLNREVETALDCDFAFDDFDRLAEALVEANDILYIGDNAGETVFDRVLIEQIGKRVRYAVRGGPVINDVTYDDAVQAGIDRCADIVTTGSATPGAVLERSNEKFRELFRSADCVISKGQGNYEALSESGRTVFFLLKAKCDVIARDLGVKRNAFIVKAITPDVVKG